MRDIAAGEDIGRRGLVGFGVDLDQAAGGFDAVLGGEEGEVGGLADREDDAVGGDILDVRCVELRAEAAFGIEDGGALNGAESGGSAMLFEHGVRAAAVVKDDALFLAFVDFDVVGGHLRTALQTDHVDFFIAAHPQGGARHVVGHLFAAVEFGVGSSTGRRADRATS